MRVKSALSFVAPAVAAAAFFLAPSAKADAVFLTVSGTVSLPRTQVASYDSSSQTPMTYNSGIGGSATGRVTVTPVHVEIDDWSSLPLVVAAITDNRVFDATIELTHPNANGVETTYLTIKYTQAQFAKVAGSYDAGGAMTQAIDFAYQKATYETPPPPASGGTAPTIRTIVSTTRPLATPTMLTRAMLAKPVQVSVSSATLTSPTTPAANATASHVSFTIAVPFDTATGMRSGPARAPEVVVTKTPDASTAGFNAALTSHKTLNPTVVTFNGAGRALYTLSLLDAVVHKDDIGSAGGAATEKLTFVEAHVQVVNKTANTTGQL